MAVVAQEWRVDNDAVKGTLKFRRQLERLLEVVWYEFLEHTKSFVDLEQLDLWPALVLPGRLHISEDRTRFI